MPEKILIVEDDNALQEIMGDYFSARGYHTTGAYTGRDALDAAMRESFDVILLDVNLPDTDGFHVCRRIRNACIDTPILFITARISEADKLNGYAEGGDDYITKPFSLPVLQAKITAMLKRRNIRIKQYGELTLNMDAHTVQTGTETISLALKEFELLSFLAENEGRLFTREQLLVRIWGYDFTGSDRVIDDHIRKLRKKLGTYRDYIRTVHGAGYRFRIPEGK